MVISKSKCELTESQAQQECNLQDSEEKEKSSQTSQTLMACRKSRKRSQYNGTQVISVIRQLRTKMDFQYFLKRQKKMCLFSQLKNLHLLIHISKTENKHLHVIWSVTVTGNNAIKSFEVE